MEQIYKYREEDVRIFSKQATEQMKMAALADAGEESAELGLARMAVMLIEICRAFLEEQAVIRIEEGSFDDRRIEALGNAFLKLDEKMKQIKKAFGL